MEGAVGTAREAIGIEYGTSLLVLGGSAYAAHGCCVFVNNALSHKKPTLLATVPGYVVLQRTTALRILFPAVRATWTLAIVVTARVPQPGSAADQIRWLAVDATLSQLRTVVAPGRAAFLMTVGATGPWTLHVEVGPEWRLHGISVSDLVSADLAAQYRSTNDWNLPCPRRWVGRALWRRGRSGRTGRSPTPASTARGWPPSATP